MSKALWLRLSFWFSLLTLISLVVLNVFPAFMFTHQDFESVVVPEHVRGIVASEQQLFAEGLKSPEGIGWFEFGKKNMSYKLFNIHRITDVDGFHISTCADPVLYFQVRDNAGSVRYADPQEFPEEIQHLFDEQAVQELHNTALRLQQEGYLWVSLPLQDIAGAVQGSIQVLFIAPFDVRKVFTQLWVVYKAAWYLFLFFSVAIGSVCGFVATLFVSIRLRQMHRVTSIWREGDLTPRIETGGDKGDILANHSVQLNAMADDLQSLMTLRQQFAVNEERNRVARELHDTVKQNLFALNLQLGALRNINTMPEVKPHIEEAEKITREAQFDLTEILTQLHPQTHSGASFFDRLESLAGDMQRRFDLSLVWGMKAPVRFTSEQEHVLVRLAQEAMNNAVRHGKATKMTMDLRLNGKEACWTIADNGCGMLQGKSDSGYGLAFMRERVATLPESSFSITGKPGEGVTVTVMWRAD